MKYALLLDFSRTLLFPKDSNFTGRLNELYSDVKLHSGFDFFSYFTLNRELITYLRSLPEHPPLYLFTTETIQDDPALNEDLSCFTEIFSAKKLELSKDTPESYIKLATIIKKKPEEIIFIDDLQKNVEAARRAGYLTILYQNTTQVIDSLNEIISQ